MAVSMARLRRLYEDDRYWLDNDYIYWETDDADNKEPHIVAGRTFEPMTFDSRAEAEDFVRDLPDAVIKYDGEIVIVKASTKKIVKAPAEVSDWGEE